MAHEVPIIESVYAIRPHLRNLIGDNAAGVEHQLSNLVKRAETGEAVDNQIIDVLRQHPETRDWVRRYLGWDNDPLRSGYQPTPGLAGAIAATAVSVCAQCGWRWVRRTSGQPVPNCPHDGSALSPVTLPPSIVPVQISDAGEDTPMPEGNPPASENAG